MKKIVLIAASLALLASPAFAQDSKTVGTAPRRCQVLDGVEGRDVQLEAQGPERLQSEG